MEQHPLLVMHFVAERTQTLLASENAVGKSIVSRDGGEENFWQCLHVAV